MSGTRPRRHGFRNSSRNGYSAVDDMTEGQYGEYPSGTYPFPIIGLTRQMAERVAVALNKAYDYGYFWYREEARQSEETEGFVNYETSIIALDLDNDQDLLERYIRPAIYRMRILADLQGTTQALELSKWLKGFVEMTYTDEITEGKNTLAATLMHAALSRVDWLDLAEHYMSGDN